MYVVTSLKANTKLTTPTTKDMLVYIGIAGKVDDFEDWEGA